MNTCGNCKYGVRDDEHVIDYYICRKTESHGLTSMFHCAHFEPKEDGRNHISKKGM